MEEKVILPNQASVAALHHNNVIPQVAAPHRLCELPHALDRVLVLTPKQMVDGSSANVGRHRVLYGQKYKLDPIGPAQDVREELADPSDDPAFASPWDSVNQIE